MECDCRSDAPGPHAARMRADFCNVVARWRLTQAEVRSLLGIDQAETCEVQPGELGPDALRRAGLAIDLDRGLSRLFRDLGQLAGWLRTPTRAFDGATPLAAMTEVGALVAMVRVAGAGAAPPFSDGGEPA